MDVRCSSSLRERTVEDTLAAVRPLLAQLGISRVTEITRLDRVDLPVFVAIRPDAEPGSVCVSAGKGVRAIEAEVGAAMEAIELAWAEHRRCAEAIELCDARVGELGVPPFGVLDFCPIWGTPIDLDAPITAAVAHDVATGRRALVPADAVIHPLPSEIRGVRYFGTHSNGLASGNSIAEATLHGLAEVIERDVVSFHTLAQRPRRVAPETLPDAIRELADRLDARGFTLVVHWLPNPYGLPAFTSIIYDRTQPELTSPGDGLHPVREIALVRSVVETAQARLSFIHGGRDDLADVAQRADERIAGRRLAALAGEPDPIDYRAVPDHPCTDVTGGLATLTAALGDTPVLRAVYTPPGYPVTVVRVVVPTLEMYSRDTSRIGRRLLHAIRGEHR